MPTGVMVLLRLINARPLCLCVWKQKVMEEEVRLLHVCRLESLRESPPVGCDYFLCSLLTLIRCRVLIYSSTLNHCSHHTSGRLIKRHQSRASDSSSVHMDSRGWPRNLHLKLKKQLVQFEIVAPETSGRGTCVKCEWCLLFPWLWQLLYSG